MARNPSRATANCPTEGVLSDFCNDLLAENKVAVVTNHVLTCDRCVELVAAIEQGLASVHSRPNPSTSPTPIATEKTQLREGRDLPSRIEQENDWQGLSTNTSSRNAETKTWQGAGDTSSADGPKELPERIGSYFILKRLGEGTFGSVYLAKDPVVNRKVAIKVPKPNRLRNAEQKSAFLAEARIAADLDHSGIVQVLDFGCTAEGGCFVVMEYIEGRSLRELLETEKLSPIQAAEMAADMAAALNHAHQRGVFHRDMKPENVLVDKDGRPHVVDFGLAIHEDDRWSFKDQFAGTRPYMSPEQIRRQAHLIDGRSDVWSLGVILYEMLLRKRPFVAGSSDQLEEEILHKPAKPLRAVDDSIPRDLDDICLRCLTREVPARYSTAIDVANDLRVWVEAQRAATNKNESSAAADSDNGRASSRRFKGRPLWVTTALAALGVLVILILVAVFLPGAMTAIPFRGRLVVVQPPRVDNVAVVGEPFPLLQHKPTKLLWSESDNPSDFDFDEEDQKLTLGTKSLRLVELNTTAAKNFELQVGLQKSGIWQGNTGVFWGFGTETDGSGIEFAMCRAVFVRFDSEQRAFILNGRSLKFTKLYEEFPDVASQTIWESSVQSTLGANCTLELRVQGGRVDAISCNRVPVPREYIVDPAFDAPHSTNAGAFGMLNELGVTEFFGASTHFIRLKETSIE